jgi:subtilase family serine protease
MEEKCNWRALGSLAVITVCLVSVMSPAMTQSSLSFFSNASNATDDETEDIPEPTPTPSPAAPNITSFTPSPPVYDTGGETKTFNIATDLVVNVSWLINGTEVFNQNNVTNSIYTNTSAAIGTWNISAIASNENGTDMQTWIWNVSQQAIPTPSPTSVINEPLADLIISAIYTPPYILKDNETRINVTIQNIGTNTNASGAFNVTFYVEKESGEGSYEIKTRISGSSAGSSENITFSWIPTSVGLYNITVFADSEHEVNESDETNNNWNRIVNVTLGTKENNIKSIAVREEIWKVKILSCPISAKEGNVTINVSIENNGTQDGNISLNFSYLGMYKDTLLSDTETLFNTTTVLVDAHSTNYTEVIWYARPLFIGPPDNITTSFMIFVEAQKEEILEVASINVELSNLSITNITLNPSHPAYNETVNVTVTIKNNENESANATLWSYEVNNTAYSLRFSNDLDELPIPYPSALGMGVYIENMYVFSGSGEREGRCSVSDKNEKSIWAVEGGGAIKDTWTRWGYGDELTIKYRRVCKVIGYNQPDYTSPAQIKSAALLESKAITLNATETKNITLNYHTQEGIYTLWALVSNGNKINKTVGVADLTVNLSANETVLDGDILNITATVENLGYINVSNFTVTFSNDSVPLYEKEIPGLCGVQFPDNTTTISLNWTATTWNADEEKHTLNHAIRVTIYSENVESDESNNHAEKTIQVHPSRDFAVTNLKIIPEKPETFENVTINATIENFGIRDGNTSVAFYIDDNSTPFAINYTYLDTGGKKYNITAVWKANLGGWRNITTMTDPGNETWERNETNNSMTMPIYIKASDFIVESISINPASPIQGNTTNINATVRNIGDKGEDNVTVQFEIKLVESPINYIFNETVALLNATNSSDLNVSWKIEHAGLYEIKAVADPDEKIPELNETNNEATILTIVQGPDLIISNISLLRANGTEIGKTDTINEGENVTIIVNVSNIGKLPANGFNVSFIDNCNDNSTIIPDTNITIPGLGINQWTEESTIWGNVSIGEHELIAVADYEDMIFETNETNNTMGRQLMVQGADLVVSDITFTVVPPEKNATTNATTVIYDTDIVTINATIKNQGILPVENFTVEMFNGYTLEDYNASESSGWEYRGLEGASTIYVHLWDISGGQVTICNTTGCKYVYDTGWYPVIGDSVSIKIDGKGGAKLRFYAGSRNETGISFIAEDGGWENVSMEQQKVSTGNYLCRVLVDTKNNVTEHHEGNNIEEKIMHVFPSRDFTVTNIIVNPEYPLDSDTVTVNATIEMGINESDPYHNYRKGTTDVDIIDEHEWVYVSPRFELTPYGYGYVITYPGADMIRVHFEILNVTVKEHAPSKDRDGRVYIRDRNGNIVHDEYNDHAGEATSPWVHGDTVYVYSTARCDSIAKSNIVIDKYQYKELNRTTMEDLTENKTGNITAAWNPSAWGHTFRVITDPDNKTNEINEFNNEKNEPLTVTPCKDPAVINLTFAPFLPLPGDPVQVSATLKNKGNKTANFSVDLWAEKVELYSYESPHYIHPGGFNECITTYPEANWTGIHFDNISLQDDKSSQSRRMHVGDKNGNISTYFHSFNGENIWAWAKGNMAELKMPEYNSSSDRGSGIVWGWSINKVAHKIILNKTTITLGSGNTTNVTGILPEVRAGNGSLSYMIYAVVDMDNVVYEMDESNNEKNETLNIAIPDLTVSDMECEGGKLIAKIENVGYAPADNVTVRFFRDVDYLFNAPGYSGSHSIPCKDEDAVVMRVHVKKLYVNEDENGYLNVSNGTLWENYKKDYTDGFRSPWMGVDPAKYSYITLEWKNITKFWGFEIDKYEYGVDKPDKPIEHFYAGMEREEEVPFTPENEVYNLTVFVDPENEIRESNEGNNKEEMRIGPDITIENITFIDMDGDEVGSDKLVINKEYTARVKVKNEKGEMNKNEIACVAATNFVVAFYLNTSDNKTIHIEPKTISLNPGITTPVDFSLPTLTRGWYKVKAEVDVDGDVTELNENNNCYPSQDEMEVKVAEPGYKADKPLLVFHSGELHGGVYYDLGDSEYECSGSGKPDINVTVNFENNIPAGAAVNLARLYLYMWGHTDDPEHPGFYLAELPEIEMYFNDDPVSVDRSYEDIPDATSNNWSYMTLGYNVNAQPNSVLRARAVFNKTDNTMGYGISGMGLVVVYGKEDAPLIRYYIAEGGDVIMAKNDVHPTGFEYGDCTSVIEFNGVESPNLANATLITVLAPYAFYKPYEGDKGDVLRFNEDEVGEPIVEEEGISHYWERYTKGNIALTRNKERGEYVDVQGPNTVEIQSRGNYFFLTNTFLNVTYPPDLEPSLEKAPKKVAIGNSYVIPVVINNVGKSKAKNFSVSFYADGGEPRERKEHVEVVEGEGSITKEFQWHAPSTPGTVEFKVVVDADNDVEELINMQHPYGESNNNVTKTVTVGLGELIPPPHPGGGGGGTGGGWGEGTGTGEGAGEGEGPGTGGEGGEGAVGEKGGKTIKGYLMKGSAVSSEEGGGGGKGEFSMLAFLLRLAMLAAAVVLVCVGYLMERRRQKQ